MSQSACELSYTVNEAAFAVGVSPRTIYRLIASGELLSFKLGARTLIRRSDLERLIDGLAGHSDCH